MMIDRASAGAAVATVRAEHTDQWGTRYEFNGLVRTGSRIGARAGYVARRDAHDAAILLSGRDTRPAAAVVRGADNRWYVHEALVRLTGNPDSGMVPGEFVPMHFEAQMRFDQPRFYDVALAPNIAALVDGFSELGQ